MNYEFQKHIMSIADGPKDTYALIAASPFYEEDTRRVTWWDPLHQRAFVIKNVVADTPDKLTFVDLNGRKFTLRPMTLATYREKVKPQIGPDARDFKTLDELVTFYTRTVWGIT